jgi:hypothetical protein
MPYLSAYSSKYGTSLISGKLLPKYGDYVKTDLLFIICASSLFLELKNRLVTGIKTA